MNAFDLVISECDYIGSGARACSDKLKELHGVSMYQSGQKYGIIRDAFKAGMAAEAQAIIEQISEFKITNLLTGTNKELLASCNSFFEKREKAATEGMAHELRRNNINQVDDWSDHTLNLDSGLHRINVMAAFQR